MFNLCGMVNAYIKDKEKVRYLLRGPHNKLAKKVGLMRQKSPDEFSNSCNICSEVLRKVYSKRRYDADYYSVTLPSANSHFTDPLHQINRSQEDLRSCLPSYFDFGLQSCRT